MTRILLATILALTALTSSSWAQSPESTPAPEVRRGVWQAELPGGTYIVRLSAITSLSMHEYIVDGTARVSEVNVATTGSELARFYVIEPLVPQTPGGVGQSGINLVAEKAGELLSRTGGDALTSKVVKNYPTTTHAHTIEYRISSKETLKKLFDSAERAWLDEKAGVFKP